MSEDILDSKARDLDILNKKKGKQRGGGVTPGKDDIIFNVINFNQLNKMMKEIQKGAKQQLKIIMYQPPKQFENKAEQLQLIKQHHDSLIGEHIGFRRCIAKLKQKYIWKDLSKMVKNYINNCNLCNEKK